MERIGDSFLMNESEIPAFKKAYDKAVEDGHDIFTFEGAEFVTAYAKYLLEYMTSVVKKVHGVPDNGKLN